MICTLPCASFLVAVAMLPWACRVLSEMVIFLFLGLSLFDTEVHAWDTGLVLWTLLFALFFRPIGKAAAAGKPVEFSWTIKRVVQYMSVCMQTHVAR